MAGFQVIINGRFGVITEDREHVIVYVGNELYGIKWRNYKMMSKAIDKAFADPTRSYGADRRFKPRIRLEVR